MPTGPCCSTRTSFGTALLLAAAAVAATLIPRPDPVDPRSPRSSPSRPSAASGSPGQAVMGATGSKTASGWKGLDGKGAEPNLAIFGAGCYWGTEAYFVKKFGDATTGGAFESTAVGFMGPEGALANPTYEQVCTGRSGHVEVLALKYNPQKVTYKELTQHFFTFHDPTTLNRQGNDRGPQYASVIFVTDEEQKKVAEEVIATMDNLLSADKIKWTGRGKYSQKKVTTAVLPATKFYAAHEAHQRYLEANPNGYCNHGIRFKWEDQDQ